jgi:hypothetical protein
MVLDILAAGLIVLAVVLTVAYLNDDWLVGPRQPRQTSGFEVKQNTGFPPVAQRKDNDHG